MAGTLSRSKKALSRSQEFGGWLRPNARTRGEQAKCLFVLYWKTHVGGALFNVGDVNPQERTREENSGLLFFTLHELCGSPPVGPSSVPNTPHFGAHPAPSNPLAAPPAPPPPTLRPAFAQASLLAPKAQASLLAPKAAAVN
jgi:hypothetical protein